MDSKFSLMNKSLSKIIFCYSPFPNREEALNIAKKLKDQKLIACANVLSEGTSVFEWDGQIHEDAEVYVVFKTTLERSEDFVRTLEELHPYEVPAIVVLEAQANLSYAQWVKEQVTS